MAKESMGRTHAAMGGSKKSKSKPRKKKSASKFKAMHIRRMSGEGNEQYSITHDQHPDATGATPEPEEHGAADDQALMAHVQQNAPNLGAPPPAEPQQMA
jgi:hypothetical protein